MYGTCASPWYFALQLCTDDYSDNISSLTALLQALDDLDNLCITVADAYNDSLTKDSYERWNEKS